ncbi:MAG: diguanylate cyclase [Pseudoduganella sp.]|jgi:diguanylate cyclase (GGDEF)-like protein|nr:diguanylate cyclase [Pseudoduganella sp.]
MTPQPQHDLDAEAARLASLRRMLSIGGPNSHDYVRTVRLARHGLQVPIAYVSIIDENCQCLAAVLGAEGQLTPREYSLCLRAIGAGVAVACSDASATPEFANNPMVRDAPYVRSFIAHPIRSAEGEYIGALCVADPAVREWTPEQLQVLEDLAFGLEAVIALRFLAGSHGQALGRVADLAKAAHTDPLTQLLNRRGITDMAYHAYTRCHLEGRGFGVAMIDLDHFKRINDNHGHDAGDQALVTAAQRLGGAVRGHDLAGRWGGEEFLAVLPAVELAEMAAIGARLVAALAGPVQYGGATFNLTASVGLAWDNAQDQRFDITGLLRRADGALYQAKQLGRNRAVMDTVARPMPDPPNQAAQGCCGHDSNGVAGRGS